MKADHPRARTYVWSKKAMSCKYCDMNYVQDGNPGYCQVYGNRYTSEGDPLGGKMTSREMAVKCRSFVPHVRRITKDFRNGSIRVAIEDYEDGGERWYEKDSMG